MIVLPVIHVLDAAQAIRNTAIAVEAGADGVWLINHSFGMEQMPPIIAAVRAAYPKLWLGVNFLAVPLRAAAHTLAALEAQGTTVDGYWADEALIDERTEDQPVARWTQEAVQATGWTGLYFGGVCFKKQR